MEKWLKTLEALLLKKFKQSEVDGVIDYYREMISERVEHGEQLESVLSSYHMKTIEKEMMVNRLSKIDITSSKELIKRMVQFFLILISTPLWIPIAVIYFVLFILVAVLTFTSVVIFVSGIVSLAYYGVTGFNQSTSLLELMLYIGLALIVFSLLSLISIGLFRTSKQLAKKLYEVFMKLVNKNRGIK